MYDLIKGKKICEGGDEMDLNPDNPDQNNAVQQVVYFISSAVVPLSFVPKVGHMSCTTIHTWNKLGHPAIYGQDY